MILSQDFREFIELLNSNHVRYLVVGGIFFTGNLKKNKRAVSRFQDLADLESLE